MQSFKHGIAKINIATAIRQPYEKLMNTSVNAAQEAVYNEMLDIINNQLEISGSAERILKDNTRKFTPGNRQPF